MLERMSKDLTERMSKYARKNVRRYARKNGREYQKILLKELENVSGRMSEDALYGSEQCLWIVLHKI